MEDSTVHNLQLIAQSHQDKLANRQYLQKYEFFFVSLTFTILGLSIQTAKFHENPKVDIFELGAWLFYLTSGILALFKLNKFHFYFTIMDYTDKLNTSMSKEDKIILLAENKINKQSFYQKVFFILGFLALIISRGYEPFVRIIKF